MHLFDFACSVQAGGHERIADTGTGLDWLQAVTLQATGDAFH